MGHSRRSAEGPVPGRAPSDDGSAALEFITTGMILLVPVLYLMLALGALQGGALAVEGAARQAARVFVQAEDGPSANAAALRAVEVALADHGIEASASEIRIGCEPDPRACLDRGAFVTVTVRVAVALPLVPSVLDVRAPLSVPLEAAATQRVSRFTAEATP